MNDQPVRERLLALLVSVAPDVDPVEVLPAVDFRDQFDFDSMDLLNFAIAVSEEFAIDVPETDYAQLASLERCEAYLAARRSQPSRS